MYYIHDFYLNHRLKIQESLCDVETATMMPTSFATTRTPPASLLYNESKMTVKLLGGMKGYY